MSKVVTCDRCYAASSKQMIAVPVRETCCLARCPQEPTVIIVAEHPRHGVWVMSVCDEHRSHARQSLRGELDVSHSEGCDGGDGFVGWDDDCTDYGGPDE